MIDPKHLQSVQSLIDSTISQRAPKIKIHQEGFSDVYPRSDEYVGRSNLLRAKGMLKRSFDLSTEYANNKKCTCNPAKRFKRASDGLVLNSCNCTKPLQTQQQQQ